jgi:hypothetical protein
VCILAPDALQVPLKEIIDPRLGLTRGSRMGNDPADYFFEAEVAMTTLSGPDVYASHISRLSFLARCCIVLAFSLLPIIFDPVTTSCPAASVWGECRGILEAELRLYEPRVVIGNGRPPSDMLREICADDAGNGPGQQPMLVSARFGCSVHRSVFITDMGEGRLARLAQDVRAHADFGPCV